MFGNGCSMDVLIEGCCRTFLFELLLIVMIVLFMFISLFFFGEEVFVFSWCGCGSFSVGVFGVCFGWVVLVWLFRVVSGLNCCFIESGFVFMEELTFESKFSFLGLFSVFSVWSVFFVYFSDSLRFRICIFCCL